VGPASPTPFWLIRMKGPSLLINLTRAGVGLADPTPTSNKANQGAVAW